MQRPLLLTLLLLVFVSLSIGQSRELLLRELLDLPAPAKIIRETETREMRRPSSFYDETTPPSDTAPIADVFDYWKELTDRRSRTAPKPSDKHVERLLDLVKQDPARLTQILAIIPGTDNAGTGVSEIFDSFQNAEGIDDRWRNSVKNWLKFNSRKYVDELAATAGSARDQQSYGSVLKAEELRALAQNGWDDAKGLLDRLSTDVTNPRTATLALVLLYEHAVSEKDNGSANRFRTELMTTAADKTLPAYSRNAAVEALSASPWPGQDDWYVSLFEDETLHNPTDRNALYSPLSTLSEKDPQKWTPVLTKLVGNRNRAVHNAAVQGLMEIESRESLRPLIPWLSDPKWADFRWSPGGRTTLMQIVSKFDLRESIPGLVWIVENDDESEVHWAARTLGEFKDERAGPPLMRALARIKDADHRKTVIRALIECSGLATGEQLRSLELYARLSLDPKKLEGVHRQLDDEDDPLPVDVSIGLYLSENTDPGEALAHAAIEREKVLRKENPSLAKVFSAIISKWKGRVVDIELLSRIDDSDVGLETIVGALARRKELVERVPAELGLMRGKAGIPGSLAACILEDSDAVRTAFLSDEVEKSTAAMACARLLRIPLPLDVLGVMLNGKSKLIAFAAERYLESEDSLDARKLVWAKHPGEALILGARKTFDPTGKSNVEHDSPLGRILSSVGLGFSFSSEFKDLNNAETRLREELKEDPNLVSIYAHLQNSDFGHRIVRVYKDRATFTIEDDSARHKEKVISKKDLEQFTAALTRLDIDNFYAKTVNCHHDCGSREFIAVSRAGGRRIYSGSGWFSLGPLDSLSDFFTTGKFSTHYRFQKSIRDVAVLLEDTPLKPVLVWKDAGGLRVLISDSEEEDKISDELMAAAKTDEADEDLDYDEKQKLLYARRAPREFEHYHWKKFSDGKLGDATDEPADVPFLSDRRRLSILPDYEAGDRLWQGRWGDYQVVAGGKGDDLGLWTVNRAERRKVGNGWYGKELVVAGDWVIAAKTDTDWADPNYLVRINLRTGKEVRVAIEPADDLHPVTFIADHGKVLIYRDTDATPSSPGEYFLLDASTGKAEKVTGQFRPFIGQYLRPLQPTKNKNKYWATIYDRSRNETEIGIYNAKKFEFKPILKLPEIIITSDKMWVDEESSRIYFVYQTRWNDGNLLSIPLPKLP